MEVVTLKAEPRSAVGSKKVAQLRADGRIPCVLYGGGGDNIIASLDQNDVERELRKHHRVFRLDLGGQVQGVLMQDIQLDHLNDRALHIDFVRIDLDKPVHVDVELAFVGHPKGAARGGALVKDKIHITVESLPAAVPEDIQVPVKDLDIGDRIHAKDLQLPPGVTLLEGTEDEIVCHLPAPKLEAAVEELEAEAAEAADEGEGSGGETKPAE